MWESRYLQEQALVWYCTRTTVVVLRCPSNEIKWTTSTSSFHYQSIPGDTTHDTSWHMTLINRGWRRSGKLLYLPRNWSSCCATISIRLTTPQFCMSKKSKEGAQKNAKSACWKFAWLWLWKPILLDQMHVMRMCTATIRCIMMGIQTSTRPIGITKFRPLWSY